MALLAVRQQFAKVSGRYDLINTDDSDNGANWYINKGQKWLDEHKLAPKFLGHYIDNLVADGFYLGLSGCRAIKEVWINDDETRVKLTYKPVEWLKENYGNVTSSLDSSVPLYWSPAIIRGIEVADYHSLGTFLDHVVTQTGNESVQGILIAPPTEEAITVDVIGSFYSPTLSSDTSASWWTENHDDILLMAALRMLEVFYRNTAGVKDWEFSITQSLEQLDFAEVEQEVHNITRLEG